MKLTLLLFLHAVRSCFSVRLTPLENNDKLQDISNQYVAEWQWESWPIKQEPTEQDSRSPGRRVNVALWKDSSNAAWYLFGGQPADTSSKKVYSDVWKYSVTTRVWERFFPSQTEEKGSNNGKIGGIMTLRANLFDEGHISNYQRRNYSIVLCGGVNKINSTKAKKQNIWNNFTRRKKQKEEKQEFELKSLAVYVPKTSKSNTVWQIDLKDKLWTAYVCCCDTVNNNSRENSSSKVLKILENKNKTKTSLNETVEKIEDGPVKNESSLASLKINKTEDYVDGEQHHSTSDSMKNKKKKINQTKKINESSSKKIKVEKKRSEEKVNETEISTPGNKTEVATNKSLTEVDTKSKKEKYNLKLKEASEQLNLRNKTDKSDKITKAKTSSKYCPEFQDEGQPVTWCDGNNEVLITADISSPLITLWVFNLRTSHWSQLEVKLRDDVKWPGCSDMNSVRYAGNEEEVYMVCSPPARKSPTNSSENPSKHDFTTKIVYRINYKTRFLDSLSTIRINSFFDSPEGRNIWKNDTQSVLQIIRTPENDTVLLLAYLDSVDLWILNKDDQGKQCFDVIEKIWRGSALKWFDKYNAVLYNLQFVAESGKSETILIPNPRNISISDYWPRERGRFIIRIFKNENLKNESFENRTREQNLTYELLQSDYKPPGAKTQLNHTYSLKVLVFFGISLAMFTVFGFVIFLKRCVNCPPRIRVRNECHKSPLVIRYSVIPDDLMYPVA